MKKLLAIVLAVACCLSCAAFIVSAAPADILADAPVNYTPWIDFTDWTEEELAPFAASSDVWTAVPSVDENGLMTLTSSNTSYVQYYAPGTNIAVKDDETGEVLGAYPGTVLSVTDGCGVADSTDATSGLCFWIDLSGISGVHENGDGTMNLYFYFNDMDFNEDDEPAKKQGKNTVSSWKCTAVVPVNYVGWVTIPFADMALEWGTADVNGKVDLNTIDWFMIYPNAPNGDSVFKIGHIGFYGSAFLNMDNYADQVPAYYTPWIDFTDWTEEELAPFAASSDVWTAVPSIDKNGLMTLTSSNTSYTQYYAPGTSVAVKDDETGEITGAYPGTVLNFNEGSGLVDSTSTENGVAFFIDLSGISGVHENGDGTMNLYFYFNDLDHNEDGSVNKSAGKGVSTSWKGTAVVPVNYVGWVTIPFADMVAEWGTPDANGKIDMNTVDWFMIYPNAPNGDSVYKIGYVGFYGPAFYDFDNYADQKPEDFTSFLDFTEWTEEELAALAMGAEGDTTVVVPTVDEDGVLSLNGSSTLGYTAYWAPSLRPATFDDETGDILAPFPGATICFAEESLMIPYKDNDEAGISMFLDLSAWEGTAESSQFVFIMEDADFNEDGTPAMEKGEQARTNFQFHVNVPAGYVGWVNIPFSEMTIRGELNPGSGWREIDANGYLDLVDISKLMIYCNVPNGESALKIGHVGFYGISEYFPVEEEPSTPTTPDDDNKNENPDTGVTGVAGIASVAAVIALAAVVCFRKKD